MSATVGDTPRDERRDNVVRHVYLGISLFGLTIAFSNFSHNFLVGLTWLIALVDFYRGLVYPIADWVFETIWPSNWPTPSRNFIDLVFILFFIKSTQFAVRAWTDWNAFVSAEPIAKVTRGFQYFWGPIYFSSLIFLLTFIINKISPVEFPFTYTLFLFGVYYLIRCVFLNKNYPLPRALDNPILWIRVRAFNYQPQAIPLKYRIRDAMLYLFLPILIEMNNHADVTLPLAERVLDALVSVFESVAERGQELR